MQKSKKLTLLQFCKIINNKLKLLSMLMLVITYLKRIFYIIISNELSRNEL